MNIIETKTKEQTFTDLILGMKENNKDTTEIQGKVISKARQLPLSDKNNGLNNVKQESLSPYKSFQRKNNGLKKTGGQ